ncbi:MAG: hypothetical protein PHF97_03855 [Bacteroidales bacterium]|nr:hypothetical protein [Bacteroidales bacterium]MDD4602924.1 hypothetical protein [Bacteroidales bacterium]
MKKITLLPVLLLILVTFFFTSCNPVSMTTWTNPKETQKIGNVVVWAMFDKLEFQKPFEQYAVNYFSSKGFKSMESLSFIAPGTKYQLKDLEKKFDSLGIDGILVVTYKGTNNSQSYVPPTTSIYPDYYYNYYNYYNWGYPMYGMGANVVTTGGYWVTSSTVNLRANLYDNADNSLIWTAEIAIDDPQYIDQISYQVAAQMYADWQKNGLLKGVTK